MLKRLAVYCGSAGGSDPRFEEAARELGRTMAERGLDLVYGGGRLGLMGIVADTVIAYGGRPTASFLARWSTRKSRTPALPSCTKSPPCTSARRR
jgi:predicted Rossmann-fold nucleotide-binding protein